MQTANNPHRKPKGTSRTRATAPKRQHKPQRPETKQKARLSKARGLRGEFLNNSLRRTRLTTFYRDMVMRRAGAARDEGKEREGIEKEARRTKREKPRQSEALERELASGLVLGLGVFDPDGFGERGVGLRRRVPPPQAKGKAPDQDACIYLSPVCVGFGWVLFGPSTGKL